MKNSQNITIVLLLVCAGILTAMLITMHVTNTPVARANTTVKQGRYIMATGTWSSSTDFVYIIDIAAQQMNGYVADRQGRRVTPLDKVDLSTAFGRARP